MVKYTCLYIAILALSLICLGQSAQTKLILAFQDGGDTLAYQAGAFKGIVDNFVPGQRRYDIVTGVAFGGLNAAIVAAQAQGDEKQASKQMLEFWQNNKYSDIFNSWLGGNIFGELYYSGMYDTTSLRQKIQNMDIANPQRSVYIGATNIDTAEYTRWGQETSGQDWVDAIMAATAWPVLFPVQSVEESSYFSGSSVRSLDLSFAIQQVLDEGVNEEDITVDVIFSSPKEYQAWSEKNRTFNSFRRSNDILQRAQAQRNYVEAVHQFPKVNFRCTISPRGTLPESNYPFAFDSNSINEMLQAGEADSSEMCDEQAQKNIIIEHYERVLRDQGIQDITIEKIEQEFDRVQRKYNMVKKFKMEQLQQQQVQSE